MLAIHHLPQVFDARRVFADEQLRNVFNRAHNRARVPFQCRFAPAPQPGWSVSTLTKIQLRMRAWQTCVSMAVIFMAVSEDFTTILKHQSQEIELQLHDARLKVSEFSVFCRVQPGLTGVDHP
jgi:hypothetical protein